MQTPRHSSHYGYVVLCDQCHGKKFLAGPTCIEILEEYFKRKREPIQATR